MRQGRESDAGQRSRQEQETGSSREIISLSQPTTDFGVDQTGGPQFHLVHVVAAIIPHDLLPPPGGIAGTQGDGEHDRWVARAQIALRYPDPGEAAATRECDLTLADRMPVGPRTPMASRIASNSGRDFCWGERTRHRDPILVPSVELQNDFDAGAGIAVPLALEA